MQMVQSKDLGGPASMQQAKQQLSAQLVKLLNVSEFQELTGF
jgi:lipoyl(octanoyl) transferase